MYGAILGDIIGSPYEFDRGGPIPAVSDSRGSRQISTQACLLGSLLRGNKTREFELFGKEAEFTDDSVMTIAVAEALLDAGKDAPVDRIR